MRETEHRVTSVLTFLSLLVAKKSRAMGVRDPVMAAVALAFRYGTEVDDINQIYLDTLDSVQSKYRQ